jgi:hypothetical protein
MKGPKRSSPCPTYGRPLTDQGTTTSADNHDPIFSPERAPGEGHQRLTGLVFFVLLCRIGLPIHGLTLVIAIALPLFVLAWTERSWALLAFAVPFLAMTVLANFRYAANELSRFGLGPHGSAGSSVSYGHEVNAAVVGAVLLLAGVIFGLSNGRAREHRP